MRLREVPPTDYREHKRTYGQPQGVLRLNWLEPLFREANRFVARKFTPLANFCNSNYRGSM